MVMRFSDPFEALFALQKQLDARLASDWLGNSTGNSGAYPPINICLLYTSDAADEL